MKWCALFLVVMLACAVMNHCARIYHHTDMWLWQQLCVVIPPLVTLGIFAHALLFDGPPEYTPESECIACWDGRPPNSRFSCGHACMCVSCVEKGFTHTCPICHAPLKWVKRI